MRCGPFPLLAFACALALVDCAHAVTPVEPGMSQDGAVAVDVPFVVDGGDPGEGGVPTGLPLAQLTGAEAQTWCTWWSRAIAAQTGNVSTVSGPDADGVRHYYAGAACWGNGPHPAYDIGTPEVTVDDCVANLTLRPCAATIAQLEACMTPWLWSGPADEHVCDTIVPACAALHAMAGCQDVLVGPFDYTRRFQLRVR